METIRYICAAVVLTWLLFGAHIPGFAKEPTTKPTAPACCELSEVQKLRIENLQLKRSLVQKEIDWRAKQAGIMELQQVTDRLEQELTKAGEQIKTENGWPAETAFDPKSGTFTPVAPSATSSEKPGKTKK